MWKYLKFDEDLTWVSEALETGTLVCVTDGSYNRKRHTISAAPAGSSIAPGQGDR